MGQPRWAGVLARSSSRRGVIRRRDAHLHAQTRARHGRHQQGERAHRCWFPRESAGTSLLVNPLVIRFHCSGLMSLTKENFEKDKVTRRPPAVRDGYRVRRGDLVELKARGREEGGEAVGWNSLGREETGTSRDS